MEPERLLFVDECGLCTPLVGDDLWMRQKASTLAFRPSVTRSRGKNKTLLCSMSIEGMGPSLAVRRGEPVRVFETFVQKVLVPSLRTRQIVVMDNLGEHRGRRGSGS